MLKNAKNPFKNLQGHVSCKGCLKMKGMIKMSEMKINLRFEGEKLFAETEITVDESVTELSFILNKGLEISEISCNEKPVPVNVEAEYEPLFCAEVKKYSVKSGGDFNRVKICYGGKISGWHNIITENIIELNRYGVWLPCELSCGADISAEINGCGEFFLVKGEFDGKLWRYRAGEWDMNLILYRKSVLKTVSGKHIDIYYADGSLDGAAEFSKNIFEDVLDYYTAELFHRDYSNHTEMACLYPALTSGGAYKRDGLIVCISPGTDEKEAVGVNAHELAHEWCSGADVGSWHDWLNETAAEWSMLLYCLDRGKNDIFDAMISEHLAKAPEFPPIKTEDGSRPEGVHTKGTVLFYEVYKAFGKETIKSVIRLFVGLETKTTEMLLDKMRTDGMTEAADIIEKNLC